MTRTRTKDPAIVAADQCVDVSSIAPARDLLLRDIERGLRQRLDRLVRLSRLDAPPGLRTSRVAAYVDLVDYVQRLRHVATDAVACAPRSEDERDAAD